MLFNTLNLLSQRLHNPGESILPDSLTPPTDQVDGAAQDAIERKVAAVFPSHGFLGEESVGAGPEASALALNIALKDEGKIEDAIYSGLDRDNPACPYATQDGFGLWIR